MTPRRRTARPTRAGTAARALMLTCGRCRANGKISYPSKGHARKAARLTAGELGAKLRPYECVECGDWHLTSQTPDRETRGQIAMPPDGAANPWTRLTREQARGAYYALRLVRQTPATPLEVVDVAMGDLLRLMHQRRKDSAA